MPEKPVPASRAGRLLHMGRLAGGIAGGMLGTGLRQVAGGKRPSVGDLLLTPANAARLAERLAEMRGAAMKVGQLLSLEASELLPRELTEILARLRQQAHAMPLGQVAAVLRQAWGSGWEHRFSRFSFTPVAAASIGQVHEAVTREGERLAIKIQYPGVRRSIDSDVDNVAALLNLLRLVPTEEVRPLLEEAKRQLHAEADYLGEAAHLRAHAARLRGHAGFVVPGVHADLTTRDVLTMEYMDGAPIESLTGAGEALRHDVAKRLIEQTLREFFDWGLVQTDPNYANYLYQREQDRIVLLDFGATRPYAPVRREAFRRLLQAGTRDDRAALQGAAAEVGYLGDNDVPAYRETMLRLMHASMEPVRTEGGFDFAASGLAERISRIVLELRAESRLWRLPPPDMMFLHRKLGGMYMLCTKLGARIDMRALLARYVEPITD